MKVIKLYGMVLENFKGVNKLSVDFEGKDFIVEGENGSKKTTLVDAFLWVLFGKDSSNRKDFEIKTIINGETIHNVNHSVEIMLDVDGHKFSLKRTFKEVYKKSRGGIENTFNGHKTEYEFNGVPCNEKEYKAKVDSIVNEEVFKLITNPLYFNSLKWQQQRKILFELVEGISIDPLKINDELKPLESVLEQFNYDEAVAVYKAKRKKIKEQVESIPTRIDELNHMNNSSLDGADEAEKEIEKIELYVDDLRGQIARINSGASIVELELTLESKKSEINKLESESKNFLIEDLNKNLTKIEEVIGNGQVFKSKKQELELKYNYNLSFIKSKKELIEGLKKSQDELRNEYYLERDRILEFNDECECPTCKQSLPSDEIKKAREKANSEFEIYKENKLKKIKEKGFNLKSNLENTEKDIISLEKENESIKEEIDNLQKELEKLLSIHSNLKIKQEELRNKIDNLVDSQEVLSLKKDIKNITINLSEQKAGTQEIINDLENEISIKLKKRNELNLFLSQKALVKANESRIEELNSQLQEYIKEFDDVDRILYLLSEYNRTKVESLSQSINELFSITEFKLFNKLVNGEYEETCEALYNGIPYNKNLNTAAKINVGLDIINVLCNHFEVSAPVFVDNAESITKQLDILGQRVSLYVKQGQNKLLFREVI